MNITTLDLTIIALPIAILLTALFSRTREDVLRAQAKRSLKPAIPGVAIPRVFGHERENAGALFLKFSPQVADLKKQNI